MTITMTGPYFIGSEPVICPYCEERIQVRSLLGTFTHIFYECLLCRGYWSYRTVISTYGTHYALEQYPHPERRGAAPAKEEHHATDERLPRPAPALSRLFPHGVS